MPTSQSHDGPLFLGIDHPAMSCRNVRELAKWYCTNLGMRIVGDNGQEPASLVLGYGEKMGGAMLEMMPIKDPGPEPASLPRFMQGFRHVAFGVRDFDAAYESLKAVGVNYLFEPVIAVGGGRIVSFRDPEGNELQIVERPR